MRNKAMVLLLVTMSLGLSACGKEVETTEVTVEAQVESETSEQVTVEAKVESETSETVVSTEQTNETVASTEPLETDVNTEQAEKPDDVLKIDKSDVEVSSEEEAEQLKVEWIQAKMDEALERFDETSLSEQDTVYLNIDNNMIEFPIIGNDLTIMGFLDPRVDEAVKNWVVTTGDIREKNGIALNIGYLNNTDNELSRNECYIGYLRPESNEHISIFFQGDALIRPGTSLVDVITALQKHGFKMEYGLGSKKIAGLDLAEADAGESINTVTHSVSDDSWTIRFSTGHIEEMKPVSGKSKHATDEMREQFNERLCQSDYIVTGNDKDGLLEIEYSYGYTDCETLGRIYDDFNK